MLSHQKTGALKSRDLMYRNWRNPAACSAAPRREKHYGGIATSTVPTITCAIIIAIDRGITVSTKSYSQSNAIVHADRVATPIRDVARHTHAAVGTESVIRKGIHGRRGPTKTNNIVGYATAMNIWTMQNAAVLDLSLDRYCECIHFCLETLFGLHATSPCKGLAQTHGICYYQFEISVHVNYTRSALQQLQHCKKLMHESTNLRSSVVGANGVVSRTAAVQPSSDVRQFSIWQSTCTARMPYVIAMSPCLPVPFAATVRSAWNNAGC